MTWLNSIVSFGSTITSLSAVATTNLQRTAHHLLPSYFGPLCRPNDFLCHHSNGYVKLEEISQRLMDGVDWMHQNQRTTLAGAATVSALATGMLLYYCCKRKKPLKAANTADNGGKGSSRCFRARPTKK